MLKMFNSYIRMSRAWTGATVMAWSRRPSEEYQNQLVLALVL